MRINQGWTSQSAHPIQNREGMLEQGRAAAAHLGPRVKPFGLQRVIFARASYFLEALQEINAIDFIRHVVALVE